MSNKQFAPTAKRLKRAIEDGNIAKSPALTGLFSITIGFALLFFSAEIAWDYVIFLVKLSGYQAQAPLQVSFHKELLLALFFLGLIITPFVGASIFAELVQLGWSITFRNPLRKQSNAPQRALQAIVNNVKTFWLPMLALIVVVWIYVSYRSSPKHLLVATWIGLLVVVLIDYSIKRYTWYRGLMMDHQQMKEEHRDSEGDPHAKAYRQAMQRAISMQSLEERVRRAKVIVVGKNAKSFRANECINRDRSTA